MRYIQIDMSWCSYDPCGPYSKLVADDASCFEPEAGPYLVEGLNFHKFYFSNGGRLLMRNGGHVRMLLLLQIPSLPM